MLVVPWTEVANAHVLQRGCREQQMREMANHESTLPPRDRRAAGRGGGGPRIWTTLAPPCLLLQLLRQRVGLPEHTELWMAARPTCDKQSAQDAP